MKKATGTGYFQWRKPEGEDVTIFVDKVSKRIHKVTVWEAFSVYGEIKDVYIAYWNRKRRLQKFTFVFIRFASRSDMLKAIKEGKGRKMDGFYILVNEARYKKQATLEGRIINKADHSQKKVGLFATSKTNGRSYKEVVQEYQEEISKIIKNFSKHAGRGKTLKGKNQKKTLLLRRCGKIKAMYNPELAQQSIVADGFQCKVSQWHGSLVTVQFDLDEEINEDETVRKERLDRAKVLAFIRKKSDIPLETTVGVEGRQYKIRIKIEEFEEEAVWIDGSMGNCQNRGCLDGEGSHSHWDTSSNWGDKWNSDEIPDVEEVNDSEKAGDEGTTKEVHGLSDIARMYNSRDNLVATCEAGQNSPMNCVACHNLQEDDLLDVPIGNATTTESEESSFCIMNYNGLVISGKGIRNMSRSNNGSLADKITRETSLPSSSSPALRVQMKDKVSGQRISRLEKCRAVRRRVQKEKANVLFIQETKAENINRAKLKSIWGTDSGEIVTSPAVRSSGGLACIWDSSFFTKRWCFLHQAFTIIVGKFQGFEEECGLVNLYALNDPAERRATFMMLEERHFAQVYNSRNSGAIKDLEGKFKAISANTQDWLERKFETEEAKWPQTALLITEFVINPSRWCPVGRLKEVGPVDKWLAPEADTLKFNTDGALQGSFGLAGIGAVT
ncbi:hypothetical protein V6N11_035360 [Hibiscus sabdariffa]|uniref:RRM domain-containing protein n=1 Tax=Hibiscus sabdariffa TaxID=183260 RepID=A0ABR2R0A0_9ROSI